MRSSITVALVLLVALSVYAQDEVESAPVSEAPALPPLTVQPSPSTQSSPAQQKADALLLYNQGRNLESAGKAAEAAAKYRESIVVCDAELAQNPTRMDAYTVKSWSLFRLARYRDVVNVGNAALKVKFDARIVEVMGEAYFHLGDDVSALKYLQRYIENASEFADRVATAYFYMAESYLRLKRFDHADIAYALAVYRDPSLSRWWFRYGSAVEALGEYARAYELYGRALRLTPGMQDALDAQARVKARL